MTPIEPRVERAQTVEKGDLFRDNDPRQEGRVVRVISEPKIHPGLTVVQVEIVEHWLEKNIGRTTHIRVDRLAKGRYRQTGYTKVSR